MRYNIQSLNALVVYVGMQAIQHIQSKGLTSSMSTIAHSAHMDIFQNLAVDMDTEGGSRSVMLLTKDMACTGIALLLIVCISTRNFS